jgi:hypothetical protein
MYHNQAGIIRAMFKNSAVATKVAPCLLLVQGPMTNACRAKLHIIVNTSEHMCFFRAPQMAGGAARPARRVLRERAVDSGRGGNVHYLSSSSALRSSPALMSATGLALLKDWPSALLAECYGNPETHTPALETCPQHLAKR